jgi:hypothetical protein
MFGAWVAGPAPTTYSSPPRTRLLPQVGLELKGTDGRVARTLQPPPGWRDINTADQLRRSAAVSAWLCQETVQGGHSVLVFCASKNACEVGEACVLGAQPLTEWQRPRCQKAQICRRGAASHHGPPAALIGLSHHV